MLCEGFLFIKAICLECRTPRGVRTSSDNVFLHLLDPAKLFLRLALDGGEDGLDFYRAICEKWRDALCESGMLFFEVGIGQADQVLRIMRSNGFGDIQIVKDLNNIPRVVYGTRVETI